MRKFCNVTCVMFECCIGLAFSCFLNCCHGRGYFDYFVPTDRIFVLLREIILLTIFFGLGITMRNQLKNGRISLCLTQRTQHFWIIFRREHTFFLKEQTKFCRIIVDGVLSLKVLPIPFTVRIKGSWDF
eukprot:Lithocolla_globosa_v1_NODE_291_length_4623_cov_19.704028.p2 type:complete len:129 gc:universal NODE_291_length_4623_cov_19.704028:1980-2366(+)